MAVELFLSGFLFGVVLLLGQLPAKADESDLPRFLFGVVLLLDWLPARAKESSLPFVEVAVRLLASLGFAAFAPVL